MSTLTRCEKGHFYDSQTHRSCPYCAQAAASEKTVPLVPPGQIAPTVPPVMPKQAPVQPAVEDIGATQGYYSEVVEKSPVVGWLVSVEGSDKGTGFQLSSGRNYIGRGPDMDIVLKDDPAVSRNKHAIVTFDPMSKSTMCQAGESRELFYLNGKAVTETVTLKKGDQLLLGKTKLVFVPFCGDVYNWD